MQVGLARPIWSGNSGQLTEQTLFSTVPSFAQAGRSSRAVVWAVPGGSAGGVSAQLSPSIRLSLSSPSPPVARS